MDDIKRSATYLAVGLGIGAAAAILLAPQSGEDTRKWIAKSAKKSGKLLSRKGQRGLEQIQDAMEQSGDKLSSILKSGSDVLSSVASKLD
jgi:gas vesicle protein